MLRALSRARTQIGRETDRLEAFSDGVIAIAITLLVLEIQIPAHAADAAAGELWRALVGLWPQCLGYVISFATIGIMWANHHTIFRHIRRTDHYLVLANLLLLFFIAAIPFPTALLADTLGHPAERVGIIVYAGWFFLTALAYNLLWRYATTDDHLLRPDADPTAIGGIAARFRLGPPAYGAALLLAFVNTPAALGLLALLALAYVRPYGAQPA